MEYIDDPVKEDLYSDDVKMIGEMILDQWSIPGPRPTLVYDFDALWQDARTGGIFVYLVSRRSAPASIDYSTLHRTTKIGIRLDSRFRDAFMQWANEIYRILMANRRTGVKKLNGNTYLEVLGDRPMNDLSGWYTTTFDVQLTSYALPIKSAGFGNDINKEIDDANKGDEE